MPARVLIVEDNAIARAFLRRVVQESFSDDLTFVEARDLDSARCALAEASRQLPASGRMFDIILCDLEQPDGSGLELLAEVSDVPSLKIATTLHLDDDHLFPALQCGASGYLLKEDRFEVLVEGLQRIARGHPPMSPAIARRILAFFKGQRAARSGSPDSGFATLSEFGSLVRSGGAGDNPEGQNEGLTAREAEVLLHLSKGFTLKEIAQLLGIKWFAIHDHIHTIYSKLAAHSCPTDALALSRQAMQ